MSLYSRLYDQEERDNERAIKMLHDMYMKDTIIPYRESDKIIDLHTHTIYSDGELTLDKLIRLAIDRRIGTLGITDHDTLEGIKRIDREASIIVDSGIQIIDGIELSSKDTTRASKGTMHILGYDIDKNNQALNNKMQQLKDTNINVILSLIEILKKDYGVVFGYEDIKALINANHNLGRPDLAKLCLKNGYVKSIDEAFYRYLDPANDKLGEKRKGIPFEESLELISSSGGIPVLAHPKTLKLSKKELLILVREMINYGLQGIEVYHSSHTPEEVNLYLELANKYDLLISGGSDYHGPTIKPNVELGTGINNNLKIKSLSLLNRVRR